jgi:diaminohydroxyphosphoribosylaminopyrimidine deaminase/5-amino-6-(5-phosphoribosylamino)uracil reductase
VPIRRVAIRIVLDSRLRLPPDSKLVRSASKTPLWVFCSANASKSKAAILERAGVKIIRMAGKGIGNGNAKQFVGLADAFAYLGQQKMTNVLVEGGSAVLGSALDAGLGDEVHAYLAPKLVGGLGSIPALGGEGAKSMPAAAVLRETRLRRLGVGWFFRGLL